MCLIILEVNYVLHKPKIAHAQISKPLIELVGKGTKVGRWDVKILSVLFQGLNIVVIKILR